MSAVHGGGLHIVADYSAAPPFSLNNRVPNFTVFGPNGRVAGVELDGSYEPERRSITLFPKIAARNGLGLPNGASLYGRAVADAAIKDLPDPAVLAALGEAMMEGTGGQTIASELPAAYTYLGQFIAHDMSKMLDRGHAGGVLNWRSAALDLDSLFGPVDRRLHPVNDTLLEAGLRLGRTSGGDRGFDDLPRTQQGEAAIPDQRNDNSLAVAQFHVAMIKFHQAVAKRFPNQSEADQRKITLQHFQAIVLFDYLGKLIDPAVYRDVFLNGRAVVYPNVDLKTDAFLIPVEFAAACFRFGHSMVRPDYMKWGTDEGGALGQMLAFTFRGGSLNDGRLPASWVAHWPKIMSEPSMRAGRADTRLAQLLFRLPAWMFPRPPGTELPGTINLAARTLDAGRRLRLPAAQVVAEAIKPLLSGRPPLEIVNHWQIDDGATDMVEKCLNADLGDGSALREKTPLWFYTLREAEHFHCGRRLGPLASRIVMETIHAGIQAAPDGIIDNANRVFFETKNDIGGRGQGPFRPEDSPYALKDLFALIASPST